MMRNVAAGSSSSLLQQVPQRCGALARAAPAYNRCSPSLRLDESYSTVAAADERLGCTLREASLAQIVLTVSHTTSWRLLESWI